MKYELEAFKFGNTSVWVRKENGQYTVDYNVVEEYFIKDNFSPAIHELPENAIVFDVGAHAGYYSLRILKERPDLTIYAFEPDPFNYGMLVKNVMTNNASNIHHMQIGLSDKVGYRTLTLREENSGSWSTYFSDSTGIPIYCNTIDNIMKILDVPHIDHIKIDIEGGEYYLIPSIPDHVYAQLHSIDLELHPYEKLLTMDQSNELITYVLSKGYYLVPWNSIGPKADLRRL